MKSEKITRESVIIKNDLQRQKLHHLNVFGDGNDRSYIDELKLFSAYFGYIPNLLANKEIDCKKARAWFEENYENEIKDSLFSKISIGNKNPEIDDVFYFLYEDMLVDFDTNCSRIRILFKKTDISKVEEIADGISKFKKLKEGKPEIFLLVNKSYGLDTEVMELNKPKSLLEEKSLYESEGKNQAYLQLLRMNVLAMNKRKFDFEVFATKSLEHICPQNPDGNDEEFHKTQNEIEEREGLHSIGNLVLLNGSANSSLSNHPFVKKKELLFDKIKDGFLLPHTLKVFSKSFATDNDDSGVKNLFNNEKYWLVENVEANKNYFLNEFDGYYGK